MFAVFLFNSTKAKQQWAYIIIVKERDLCYAILMALLHVYLLAYVRTFSSTYRTLLIYLEKTYDVFSPNYYPG